ncbi:MAG TPA: hypothetical protein VH054_03600 [Polyangiaceae bacterium]|nr:hypothetical protein [Polyangiaceae bacterium]
MKARALLVAASLSFVALPAHAQDVNARDSWSGGRARPFVSTTIDFGFLYMRPRATFGWGRPFSTWFGVELNPIFVSTGVGAYGGLRAAFPFFDVRVGARGFYAFDHGYLVNQSNYAEVDLNTNSTGNAVAVTYETEVRGVVRAGPGDLGLLASLSTVTNVPAGMSVYEETLHVIVRPPVVWRMRLGYSFFVATGIGRFSITPVVEVLGNPSRDAFVVRAGILASYLINKHLEVRGTFVPMVAGPDSIGILGSDFTELGLRYRWASGD